MCGYKQRSGWVVNTVWATLLVTGRAAHWIQTQYNPIAVLSLTPLPLQLVTQPCNLLLLSVILQIIILLHATVLIPYIHCILINTQQFSAVYKCAQVINIQTGNFYHVKTIFMISYWLDSKQRFITTRWMTVIFSWTQILSKGQLWKQPARLMFIKLNFHP